MTRKNRIAYFGSPENSAQMLRKLHADLRFQIAVVVTQPDRPIGRRKVLTPTAVAQCAESLKLQVVKPERDPKIKSKLLDPDKLITQLQHHTFDLILSYEFGQLLPEGVLSTASKGALNIHFSLLPAYRGANPLPWQILHQEKQTGITLLQMDTSVDSGQTLYQEAMPIHTDDTAVALYARLSSRALEIVPDILDEYIIRGTVENKDKPAAQAESYFPRMTRDIGYINWDECARAVAGEMDAASKIERMLRALNPWPGVYTLLDDDKRLKILEGRLAGNKLENVIVQKEGKKKMSWEQMRSTLSLRS